MEESEENMSTEDVTKLDSPSAVKKPKKRSLVERELETNLTARVTSPAIIGDGLSTSRYGRTRRLKTETELIESQKVVLASIKSPGNENTPVKAQSPVYRMHASNSPCKAETPKKALVTNLDNQIDNIYQENISLSRFSDETSNPSPAKKFPKVYIRKDLIQKREADETIMLIKNLFSPSNSATKTSTRRLSNLEHSSEKYNSKQNGFVDNISVVKTLDFDGNKKRKKENKDQKPILTKNELFEVEATCPFQVGDLAWARMGTFPFWPCIITRDPYSEMFVRKKLFGRVEHDIIHVTFFGDNGRRSWVVDNMLRNYRGVLEFKATREKFTPEDKKKDPKLYSAFFVSEKKQGLWNKSVEEAEILLREPKRLRVDIFNDMLLKFRASKKHQKSGKITRTDSDVSLSESLYDSLFSEGEVKTDDTERSINRSRNKSFDVSEVVTACLDNMAAKTGITKIQRQSHMDRWLQKAKSKTPEKTLTKPALASLKAEKQEKPQAKPPVIPFKLERNASTKTNKIPNVPSQKLKVYRLRRGHQSHSKLSPIAIENSKGSNRDVIIIDDKANNTPMNDSSSSINYSLEVITKAESIADEVEDSSQEILTVICVEDDTSGPVLKPKNVLDIQSTSQTIQDNKEMSDSVAEVKQEITTIISIEDDTFETVPQPKNKKKLQHKPVQANSELSDSVAKVKQDFSTLISADGDTSKAVPKPKSKKKVQKKPVTANSELSDSVTDVKHEISTIIATDDDTSKTVPKPKSKKKLQTKPVQSNSAALPDSIEEIKQDSPTIISIDDDTSKTVYRSRNKKNHHNTSIDNSKLSDSVEDIKQDSSTVISIDGDASEEVHKIITKKKYQTKLVQAFNELSDHVEEVKQDTSIKILVDNDTPETIQEPHNRNPLQPKLIQSKSELSDHIEQAKQETSTTNAINGKNSNNFDLTEKLFQEKSEYTIRKSIEIYKPPETGQDFAMEIAEEMKNHVQDINEKSKPCEVDMNSAMEIDVDTSFACQVDEEKSNLKSETVSNESLEDNKVRLTDDNCNVKSDTDLKEAENVVTIVASVTETKNDDTLNYQEDGGQQESNAKRKPSKSPETTINNIELDYTNSLSSKMEETIHATLDLKKISMPEISKEHGKIETKTEIIKDIWPEKLDLAYQDRKLNESNIFHNPKDTIDQKHISSEKLDCIEDHILHSNKTDFLYNPKDKTDRIEDSKIINITRVQVENNMSDDKSINDKDMTEDITNVLDESGNSESILQLNKEVENEDCLETLKSELNGSFESNKSESILESCTTKKNNNEVETNIDKSKPILEENHDYSTRHYVESPTFTQLLESEEFFLDTNETYDSGQKSNSSETFTQNGNENKVDNTIETVDEHKTAVINLDEEDEDEETTDDEPSPEYESLDEDITEDFRKHMMSIESNITDKKDEEQIVKICNEIAEKAKLSPTKYTTEETVVKPKEVDKTRPKDKSDINTKSELDASPNKLDKSIEMQNRCKVFFEASKKESEGTDKQESSDIKTQNIPDKIGDIKKKCELDSSPNDKLDKIIEMEDVSKVFFESSKKGSAAIDKQKSSDIKTQNIPDKIRNIKKNRDLDASPNDKLDKIIKMQDKCKVFLEASKTESEAMDKKKSSDINIQNIHDKIGDIKKNSNRSDSKINGDATVTEISDKTKIIYRTRLSLNVVNKAQASPDIQLESSSISCQYEPKVVITPLERDKLIFSKLSKFTDIRSQFLDEEKSKSKNNKFQLSLKRDSPKSILTDSKSTDNSESGVKLQESKNLKPESLVTKEKSVTLNKSPKTLNIENSSVETNIPESVKVNGYRHDNVDRKCGGTPDLADDTDFDIDTISVNSEDSENSVASSIECVPRRNLRSRPERTLENALKNIEFLKYLELRQDYLIEEHPELNEDEVVSYVYKTWQYEQDLKSDFNKCDESHNLNLKGLKQETPSRKKSKKLQPKHNLENHFREKYAMCRKTFDLDSGIAIATFDSCEAYDKQKVQVESSVNSEIENIKNQTVKATAKRKTRSKSPVLVDLTSEHDMIMVKDKYNDLNTVSVKSEECLTPKRSLRSKTITPKSLEKQIDHVEEKNMPSIKVKEEREFDTESIDSEDSEVPLRQLRSKFKINGYDKEKTLDRKLNLIPEIESTLETEVKEEADETASTVSDSEPLLKQKKRVEKKSLDDPEFIKYLALRQDVLVDENPQLTKDEVVSYLYKTWLYEENSRSDLKKNDELETDNLVKGLNNNESSPPKKARRKPKVEKKNEDLEVVSKEKPRRKTVQPYYNENFSDIEDELEVFEIFVNKKSPITVVSKAETDKIKGKSPNAKSEKDNESPRVMTKTEGIEDIVEVEPELEEIDEEVEYVDAIELYFTQLTKPKPNVFKGLLREKVCELCEYPGNLVKCKGCNGMFHPDCVKKETEAIEKEASLLSKAKRRKKKVGRKRKSQDSESQSDEKSQDVSVDMSVEDIVPPEILIDADTFEEQLAAKMKEILDTTEINYDYYSSDDNTDWKDTAPGKCEIVDVKFKPRRAPIDYSDFKCDSCQKYDVPVCFVCKSAVSKADEKVRQKCNVPHCYKYYHVKCLDHWPQTQFNSGEPSKSNKKISEFFEALTCPRHVCHTCVSDDPRGCKTRFSGDKLAKCVRCPATYHSFNKCLPAGSQILTASHIICPRHSDLRPAKVPCHVNTGWCFICAQGGSLICCEYCPTSFHAECLNIKPPEGNYMCEDCETGRLPLYGEMVWVKLGHYRWWPGIVLHPSEIPENIMAAKHGLGEFVVRFFGQYDHYWVNRGRVFPYQEGDSGRISGTKSKIDADFTLAIEHAQRAYTILKNAEPNGEESLDIASSLLPPHYVKLKCNKPCGSLCGRKVEDPSLSLTQCECNPDEPEPCGPYSQCLNRMLLTECGPTCRAGDRCNNRAFEKRLYPKLVPYRTPHRGWGLKTLEDIKAGQFVIEYVGELIDEEEFKRRMRRKHEIRDENFYFLTLDKERMIDAGPKGNAARFMNHCCEPNCETQKWTVLGDIRVGLFAIDDIPANSEVTFNYLLECAGIEKKRCLCGAKRCSGYIGAKPKQEESQPKRGKDGKLPGKRTYKKKIKVEESPTAKIKPKRPLGRPPKPKELTEIEKDLLIIKNATNSLSSDESSRSQSIEDKNPKTLKRKRVSISTEEVSLCNGLEPSVKKQKCEDKPSEVGD